MSLSGLIRESTGPIHARVEALPLARSMAEGTVDLDDYTGLLQRLLLVHQGWESALAAVPACANLWSSAMARAHLIERDLVALGSDPIGEDHPATLDWLDAIRTRAEISPEVWFGVIYLFEGSRMGSMALLRPLAQGLGVPPLPGTGLDYHLDGVAGLVPRWQGLKRTLDALDLNPAQQEAIVWAATVTFEMLHELYAVPSGATSALAS